jgi:hypothetical protein
MKRQKVIHSEEVPSYENITEKNSPKSPTNTNKPMQGALGPPPQIIPVGRNPTETKKKIKQTNWKLELLSKTMDAGKKNWSGQKINCQEKNSEN